MSADDSRHTQNDGPTQPLPQGASPSFDDTSANDPSASDTSTLGIPALEPAGSEPSVLETPVLDVGLLVAPGVAAVVGESVGVDVAADLERRYPGIGWNVVVAHERLAEPPVTPLDLMETARDRMLEAGWDVVLVVTDLPLKDGRRVVQTQLSPVHGVGLLVVPALGLGRVAPQVRATCVRLVEELLDFDDDDTPDDVVRRARQRADDVELRDGESPVQFAARVLGGNLGVLVGLVRANRPLTLALRLTQLIAVTAAAGALMLITPDIWVLAVNYGPVRLVALSLIAVAAVTVSLILGAKLWERPRRRAEREQVMLFNLATVLTMTIGVTVFYLAVFVLALAAAFVLLDGRSFAQLSSQSWSVGKIVEIAWMTASLATVGGAVGAGLEEDDIIRAAAYTRAADVD